jgi:hypothetical protein
MVIDSNSQWVETIIMPTTLVKIIEKLRPLLATLASPR